MPSDHENPRPNRDRRDPRFVEPLQKLFDRLPPHSLEAEMSLLGSMILDPQVIADVIAIVRRPEDFYDEKHTHIYKAIVDVFDAHHSGDLVQLGDLLNTRGVLDAIGGGDYLVKLAESVPAAINAPHYARLVAEKAKLRRLIDAAGQILYDAYHTGDLGPDGAREVLDRAETSVFDIAQEAMVSDPQALADLLQIEIDRIEASEGKGISGISTGYPDMDRYLSGLQKGEMVILAARPSMGKTALALNLAEQIAFGGHPAKIAPRQRSNVGVGVFSLEMSKSAVTQRLLSASSGIDSKKIREGTLSDAEFREALHFAGLLGDAPVYIDDTPGLTVLNLRARARRMVAQQGVQVLIVDYLQLLTAPGSARESRQVEVSAISRGIKSLARELNVPVICLSQLNRASEQRTGNRPRMSDLRESGSIEQDADVIMLLHREDYYHIDDPEWQDANPDKVGVAEIIIAKQRNGPTGVVELMWDSHTTRFKSLGHNAPPAYQPPPVNIPQSMHQPPASGFAPGKKSGPVSGHRDGGGPDRDSFDDPGVPF